MITQHLTTLEHLQVTNGSTLSDYNMHAVAANLPHLRSLSIPRGAPGIGFTVNLAQRCEQLESLTWSRAGVLGEQLLHAILTQCPRITHYEHGTSTMVFTMKNVHGLVVTFHGKRSGISKR